MFSLPPTKPRIAARTIKGGLQGYILDAQLPPLPNHTDKPAGRYVGTCKFYNAGTGLGYITKSNGGKDILVRESDLMDMGLKELFRGQQVSFDVKKSGKHKEGVRTERAVNIRVE